MGKHKISSSHEVNKIERYLHHNFFNTVCKAAFTVAHVYCTSIINSNIITAQIPQKWFWTEYILSELPFFNNHDINIEDSKQQKTLHNEIHILNHNLKKHDVSIANLNTQSLMSNVSES